MPETDVPHPPIASRDAWQSARDALLADEKALTRQRDRVNAARRRLPMVRLEKDYRFTGPGGPVGLRDLFDGRRQLIVYHFMFDPAWDTPCLGCTGYVDALGDLSLLAERDTTLVLVSRAPQETLAAWKARKGWTLPWLSSFGSDFNADFHATLPTGESQGLSVFFRLGDEVFHTYSTYRRGAEGLHDSVALLDITPYGRQEDFEDSPPGWPKLPADG